MVVPFNPEILLLGIHPKEIIYNKDETLLYISKHYL